MVPNPFSTLLAVRQPRPVSRRTPLLVMTNCTEGSGPSLVFHTRSGCPRVEARLLLLSAGRVDTLDPVGEASVVNVSRNPHCAQNRSLGETFSPQAGHEQSLSLLDAVFGTSLILPAKRIVKSIMRFALIPRTQAFREEERKSTALDKADEAELAGLCVNNEAIRTVNPTAIQVFGIRRHFLPTNPYLSTATGKLKLIYVEGVIRKYEGSLHIGLPSAGHSWGSNFSRPSTTPSLRSQGRPVGKNRAQSGSAMQLAHIRRRKGVLGLG